MALDPSEVRQVARLARLELSDADLAHFTPQIAAVLDYVRKLDERLRSTRDTRVAATIGYAVLAYALIAAALVLRSAPAGTAALLSLPAAAAASLALSLAGVTSWWSFVLAAAALVLGGTWLARSRCTPSSLAMYTSASASRATRRR